MEIEKKSSKGSFRSLFGGNGKPRKKLLSANPSLPDDLKQAKDSIDEISTCGTKAPSLVARLMGLDSLPASTVNELSSSASHKLQHRPIQRFQTQMLPPKSTKAKPIPLTHNKPSRNTNNVNTVKGRSVSPAIQSKAKVQSRVIFSPAIQSKAKVQSRVISTSIVDSKKPTRPSSNRSSRRVTDTQKNFPLSKTKSGSQKKRCTKRGVLPDDAVNSYEIKSIKCSITTDGSGSMPEDAVKKKESEDVVSFTFTFPLRRESHSQSYTQINNIDANPSGLCTIESQCTQATQGSSAVLPSSMIDTSFHSDPHGDNLHRMLDYGCSSSYDPELNMNQESEAVEENSCGIYSETENDQSLDIPFVRESSLDGEDNTHGSTVCFRMQEEASIDQRCCTLADDKISNVADCNRSRNSELEYVKDLLGNITELMEQNFILNQTNRVMKPDVTESYGEDYSKLERKLLFDCVTECLQLKPKKTSVHQSEVLWTEDLYRQILGFKGMQDVIMMDFEIEAFEEGLEIERDISTSLINELVSDLLLH